MNNWVDARRTRSTSDQLNRVARRDVLLKKRRRREQQKEKWETIDGRGERIFGYLGDSSLMADHIAFKKCCRSSREPHLSGQGSDPFVR